MYPVICTIGPVSVYSYGLMLAISAVVCSWLLSRDARREGYDPERFFDLVFWVVIGGVIGARVFYVLLNLDHFWMNPGEWWMLHQGGLAWQGSMAGAFLTVWVFIRRQRWSFLRIADLIAPYLALGQAIGRLGCFLNGCCHGRHWDHGIYLPAVGDHVHPAQLYDALGLVILFFILKQVRRAPHAGGLVFVYYFLGASALRFFVQFVRYDYEPLLLGLGVYQWVALGVFVTAVVFGRVLAKGKR